MERSIIIRLLLHGAKEVAAGMQQISGTVTKTASGFKKQLSDMADHARWASLFIGAAFSKVASDILNLASNFEKFSIATEYLTGSAEQADKFAASMRKLATETIFGLDQVTELGKRLVGNTKDVDKSEKALMSLVDAVAATGGGYNELESATRAWIQTNSKAKASSEELNRQFANANIPVLRVLSEAIVNDINHPLRKYLELAGGGGATGVTEKLTKAYQGAVKVADDARWKYDELNASIEKQKNLHGENSWQVTKATDKMKEFEQKHRSATATMTAFEQAQSNTNRTMVAAKLTVEDVMAQLQEVGDLNIPGTIMADAVTEALNRAYGGANQKLVESFAGQLEKLKDKFKLIALSFVGLDDNFRRVEGGMFDRLASILIGLNNLLDKVEPQLVKFGETLGKSLPFMIGLATFAFGIFAGFLGGILAPVMHIAIAFGLIGAAVGVLVTSFIDLSPIMGGLNESFGMQNETVDELLGRMSMLPEEVEKLRIQEEEAKRKTDALRESVDTLFGSFDYLIKSVETVGRALGILGKEGENAKLGLDKLLILVSGMSLPFELVVMWLTKMIYNGRMAIEAFLALYEVWRLNLDGAAEHIVRIGELQKESDAAMFNLKMNMVNHLTDINNAWWGSGVATQNFASTCDASLQSCVASTNTYLPQMQGVIDTGMSSMVSVVNTSMFTMDKKVDTSSAKMTKDLTGSMTSMYMSVSNEETGLPKMASLFEENYSTMQSVAEEKMPIVEKETKDAFDRIAESIGGAINKLIEWVRKVQEYKPFIGFGLPGLHFQHGGVVPGPIGSAVPIVAHAGERVIPRSGVDANASISSSGATVNFYGNMQIDSEARVQELADRINRILGRQNELARYGAGY